MYRVNVGIKRRNGGKNDSTIRRDSGKLIQRELPQVISCDIIVGNTFARLQLYSSKKE
jgi:hypothetical protein